MFSSKVRIPFPYKKNSNDTFEQGYPWVGSRLHWNSTRFQRVAGKEDLPPTENFSGSDWVGSSTSWVSFSWNWERVAIEILLKNSNDRVRSHMIWWGLVSAWIQLDPSGGFQWVSWRSLLLRRVFLFFILIQDRISTLP